MIILLPDAVPESPKPIIKKHTRKKDNYSNNRVIGIKSISNPEENATRKVVCSFLPTFVLEEIICVLQRILFNNYCSSLYRCRDL